MCVCEPGFESSAEDRSKCQDIDECRRQDDSLNGIFSEDVRDVQEVPLCQNGLCVNTVGGFECQCPDQWILKVGGKTQN